MRNLHLTHGVPLLSRRFSASSLWAIPSAPCTPDSAPFNDAAPCGVGEASMAHPSSATMDAVQNSAHSWRRAHLKERCVPAVLPESGASAAFHGAVLVSGRLHELAAA